MLSLRDQVFGMFLGVGVGDSLGMPNETFTFEQIQKRGRIISYQPMPVDHQWHHDQKAGETTDDWQLTQAVARAFIQSSGKFDMDEIARQHIIELDHENRSWGPSTRNAVKRLKAGVHWSESGKTNKPNSGMGNGVIMKSTPLAAYLRTVSLLDDEHADPILDRWHEVIRDFTFMTHPNQLAASATAAHIKALTYCMYNPDWMPFRAGFLDYAYRAAAGQHPKNLLERNKADMKMLEIIAQVEQLADASDEEIVAAFGNDNFMVYNSYGMSHAFFLRKPDTIEALYDVVNAGGDTDSNGAIVGSMLGALHGPDVFPKYLKDGLLAHDEIFDTANSFCDALGID